MVRALCVAVPVVGAAPFESAVEVFCGIPVEAPQPTFELAETGVDVLDVVDAPSSFPKRALPYSG